MKRFWYFLQKENLHYVLMWVVILVSLSAMVIALVEPEITLADSVWWSIVTLTTVGYGDFSPVTPGGRLVAVVIMFFGIGLLGMLSATLASILISKRLRENKGMTSYSFQGHIIICEWNHRARAIVKELRADSQTKDTPVVLIADIDEKPLADSDFYFIKGSVSEETLGKAGADQAATVVILGDDHLEETARDAKVVLSTLTVECICPDAYTVVELVDEKNSRHCQRAQADEIIVGSELSSHLVASAAINHGISHIVSEILSTQYGNDLYSMPVPAELGAQSFLDVLTTMKTKYNCTVLGVQKGRSGKVLSNPPAEYAVDPADHLIVVGARQPGA